MYMDCRVLPWRRGTALQQLVVASLSFITPDTMLIEEQIFLCRMTTSFVVREDLVHEWHYQTVHDGFAKSATTHSTIPLQTAQYRRNLDYNTPTLTR